MRASATATRWRSFPRWRVDDMGEYLSREPIAVDALIAQAAAPDCGGTCVFLGTVRNGPEESGVAAIEYSAYDDMAEAELQRIVGDARERWPGARIALRHRLGHVAVGERTIAIVSAAPHRAPALEASSYGVEHGMRSRPGSTQERRS